MSTLQSRLQRMKSQRAQPTTPETAPAADGAGDAWAAIGAGEVRHGEGAAFVERVARYPLSEPVGRVDLRDLVDSAQALEHLTKQAPDESLEARRIRAEDVVFFDTETTGLGVGTGNVPFMLGAGCYEDGCFTVRQWFIRGPAEEAAMLAYFRQWLSRFSVLVTFNGKSFDWPVMATRFVMNRLDFESDGLLHVDLLYPSRRMWKHVLPSCRLGMVEQAILGLRREGDVPGSQAPALYFQYLADRNVQTIAPVFHHNDRDIVGLAALASLFAGLVTGSRPDSGLSAEEHVRLAMLCDPFDRQRAQDLWASFLDRSRSETMRYLPLAASHAKKSGNVDLSARLWQDWLAAQRHRPVLPLEPFVQLAMYWEHVRKDYDQAYSYAERALQMALKRRGMARGSRRADEELAAVRHRLQRLERKRTPVDPDIQQSVLFDDDYR